MRLTDYTDYSLRVMLYLAVRREGLATIQDISDAYGISKNHLMKVVQRLGELGWVETVRGRNGGLRLFEHSGSVTVGEPPALRDRVSMPAEGRARGGASRLSIRTG